MSDATLVPVATRGTEDRADAPKLRHLIESQQFTVPLLMELFHRSHGMERVVARGRNHQQEEARAKRELPRRKG